MNSSGARIAPGSIRKAGQIPTNASIFQTFMSGRGATGEPAPYFGQYPPNFFDFIIVDECHRGGANDESTWRGILDYFAPAVQLGLTATPRRRDNVDTYAYFGEPVYTYSLGAHRHFNDPERDGEPLDPEPAPEAAPRERPEADEEGPDRRRRERVVIRLADGKARELQHMSATSFCSPDGRPLSATQFLEALYGALPEFFKDEDELRAIWRAPETRAKLLTALRSRPGCAARAGPRARAEQGFL